MRLWHKKEELLAFFGKNKFAVLIALLGLLLILIPFGKRENKEASLKAGSEFDLSDAENRLESILERGNGVGRVKVMLTLEKTSETLYVTEGSVSKSENGSDEKTEISRISSSSGEQPLIREQRSPVYRGALILCDGADDPRVRLWVTEAVGSLLGIGSDRISVKRMAEK